MVSAVKGYIDELLIHRHFMAEIGIFGRRFNGFGDPCVLLWTVARGVRP